MWIVAGIQANTSNRNHKETGAKWTKVLTIETLWIADGTAKISG